MAAPSDTIPQRQLSIRRIAERVDIGGLEPQRVSDLIIDHLLAGDRSRWVWVWRGPGWQAGMPPLSRMALEDYLDFLERRIGGRHHAEFMAWARNEITECVLLEAHELAEILQVLDLRVTPWLEMWQASFSPWDAPGPEPVEAFTPLPRDGPPPTAADKAETARRVAFSLECDRCRLTGDALSTAWDQFNARELERRKPTPAQTTPPRRGRPPTVDKDEIRDIYEQLTPEERGKSLHQEINKRLADRAASQGRAVEKVSRATIYRALSRRLKNQSQK
jgi:hypothetical protein